PIDQVRTVRESRSFIFAGTHEGDGGSTMLLATGRLTDFASCYGRVHVQADESALLDTPSAVALGLKVGDSFLAVSR
ncbi:MAG TPA: arginine N-succinyltransferase, partial [Allosphingosinicella sp.]|nr:arginine N-succinyltransferase [Allosphingosinicella sp.]